MYQGKFLAENRAATKADKSVKAAALTADQIMDEELAAAQQEAQAAPVIEKEATPAKAKKAQKKNKKKKGIRVGTVIFYLFYLMLIGAAAYGINYGLGLLNDWLTVYEASQPDTRSREIFNEYFADPDWARSMTWQDLPEPNSKARMPMWHICRQKLATTS